MINMKISFYVLQLIFISFKKYDASKLIYLISFTNKYTHEISKKREKSDSVV